MRKSIGSPSHTRTNTSGAPSTGRAVSQVWSRGQAMLSRPSECRGKRYPHPHPTPTPKPWEKGLCGQGEGQPGEEDSPLSPEGPSDVFVTPTHVCSACPSFLSDRPPITKSLDVVLGTVGSEIKQGPGCKSKQESGSHLPLRLVVGLGLLIELLCAHFCHLENGDNKH